METWPEDWAPPRDPEAAGMLDAALSDLVALTEDDKGTPALPLAVEGGPPSISERRLDDYAASVWAVYELRQLWKSLGPRVEAIRQEAAPGRSDPCPCGSGEKFKKCRGA